MKKLLDQFATSSTKVKIATIAAIVIWTTALVALIVGTIYILLGGPEEALPPIPTGDIPEITLEPDAEGDQPRGAKVLGSDETAS